MWNFMLIRFIVLKVWRFEIFADLAWNAYSRPPNFGFGDKIWEGIFGFRPQPNQFFRFRPQMFLPNLVKIGWKCDRKRSHRHTHTYTHKKTDLIICPMLWYSNGTDKYTHRTVTVNTLYTSIISNVFVKNRYIQTLNVILGHSRQHSTITEFTKHFK